MGEVLADAAAEREHLVGARLDVGRAGLVDELRADGVHQRARPLAGRFPCRRVPAGEVAHAVANGT